MRWQKPKRKRHPNGEVIHSIKFLWLPKKIKDTWVWLENVNVEKTYHTYNAVAMEIVAEAWEGYWSTNYTLLSYKDIWNRQQSEKEAHHGILGILKYTFLIFSLFVLCVALLVVLMGGVQYAVG